jgi:hypothetical protein
MARRNKTKATQASVETWLGKIRDDERRGDCEALIRLMKKVTGEPPRMWGSMVGFGQYHYRYESGHEGDCFQVGFASRKPDVVLYVMSGPERHAALLEKLGKHRLGKSCLYLRRLADADPKVLEKLLTASVREMKAT